MDKETRDLIAQICVTLRRGDIAQWEALKKVIAVAAYTKVPEDRHELIQAIVVCLLPDGVREALPRL